MSRIEGALGSEADVVKGRARHDTGRAKRDASMMKMEQRRTLKNRQAITTSPDRISLERKWSWESSYRRNREQAEQMKEGIFLLW